MRPVAVTVSVAATINDGREPGCDPSSEVDVVCADPGINYEHPHPRTRTWSHIQRVKRQAPLVYAVKSPRRVRLHLEELHLAVRLHRHHATAAGQLLGRSRGQIQNRTMQHVGKFADQRTTRLTGHLAGGVARHHRRVEPDHVPLQPRGRILRRRGAPTRGHQLALSQRRRGRGQQKRCKQHGGEHPPRPGRAAAETRTRVRVRHHTLLGLSGRQGEQGQQTTVRHRASGNSQLGPSCRSGRMLPVRPRCHLCVLAHHHQP